MSINEILNIGEHGQKSQAPVELENELAELVLAVMGEKVPISARVRSYRAGRLGNLKIKLHGITKMGTDLTIWTRGQEGRRLILTLYQPDLDQQFFDQLQRLIHNGLTMDNYEYFLRTRGITSEPERAWTDDAIKKLVEMISHKYVASKGTPHSEFLRIVSKLAVINPRDGNRLKKHIEYLFELEVVVGRYLGPKYDYVAFGKKGKKLVLSEYGIGRSIDDNELANFVEDVDYVELQKRETAKKLTVAESKLSKAAARLERAKKELETAQQQYGIAELQVRSADSFHSKACQIADEWPEKVRLLIAS